MRCVSWVAGEFEMRFISQAKGNRRRAQVVHVFFFVTWNIQGLRIHSSEGVSAAQRSPMGLLFFGSRRTLLSQWKILERTLKPK
jgi:hypothetical protein